MVEYSIIKSKRKTISIEINDKLDIIVRSPENVSRKYIDSIVKKHEQWIAEHRIKKQQYIEKSVMYNTSPAAALQLKEETERIIPEKVAKYSKIMGLVPTGVKITSAKKRFGSCSGKNSLCFSLYLAAYPEEAVDYVVVHELAHIKYKNHGRAFYALIKSVLPDYKARERMLKSGMAAGGSRPGEPAG